MKVFIVGCGRSGTTLIRKALNNHPELFIPTESLCLIDYLKYGDNLPSWLLNRLLFNEPQLKLWYKGEKLPTTLSIPEKIALMHEMEMKKAHKKFWGQKTPRFIRSYDILKKTWPDIKFIFVYRDPRAVMYSFKNSASHVSDDYAIAVRWNNDNQFGLKLMRDFPQDSFSLKFENFLASPAEVLKEICAFLNITYSEQMLNYSEKGIGEYHKMSQKILSKLHQPPSKDVTFDWKGKLSSRSIAIIESIGSDTIKTLGYSFTNESSEIPNITLWVKLKALLAWLPVIYNYFKDWPVELFYVFMRKFILSVFNRSLKPFKN